MRLWLPWVCVFYWVFIVLFIISIIMIAIHSQYIPIFVFLIFIVLLFLFSLVADVSQKKKPSYRLFPIVGRLIDWFAPAVDDRPFDKFSVDTIEKLSSGEKSKASFGYKTEQREYIKNSLYPIKDVEIDRIKIGDDSASYTSNRLNFSALGHGPVNKKMILALGMASIDLGCFQNTGEDGLSGYHTQLDQDLCLQLGTGYLGFNDDQGNIDFLKLKAACRKYPIRMIEVKLSQGAKPGAGGYLPGAKVTSAVARDWNVPVGKSVITPPSHPGIDGPKTLLKFLRKIREATDVPVGIKFCLGRPEEFKEFLITSHNEQVYPDFLTVDGALGGTGAANIELMRRVGMPLFDALNQVSLSLKEYELKGRIKTFASGRIMDGYSFLKCIALGADGCNIARSAMIASGCVQARRCHSGNCPSGISTSNPLLMAGLDPTAAANSISNLHRGILENAKTLMISMGAKDLSEVESSYFVQK